MSFYPSNQRVFRSGLVSLLACGTVFTGYRQTAIAQITEPLDNSLGTTINFDPTDPTNITILGTPQAGNNLFHRFGQFNVDSGDTVSFESPADTNIFSQVVGGSPSSINGTIQALNANSFFLINPAGIIFGPNASLDIEGSFVATTANSVAFPIGGAEGLFSPSSQAGDLITFSMNPSALVFSAAANRALPFSIDSQADLRVPNGEALLLAGNDIAIDGIINELGDVSENSNLSALGGQVNLAAMQGIDGRVNLLFSNGNPEISEVSGTLADIELNNFSRINVRAGGGGGISLYAQNLSIRNGSQLIAGIGADQGNSDSQAGDIEINVSDAVILRGFRNFFERSAIINSLGISEDSAAQGRSGNILINAREIRVLEGGQIFASTFEDQDSGQIRIDAVEAVYITGAAEIDGRIAPSQIFNRVEEGAQGNAGLIRINTNFLSATGGGRVSTSTRGFGDAGTVEVGSPAGVVVTDGFAAIGLAENQRSQSGISSEVAAGATGEGGNIVIRAADLRVTGGAGVNTTTSGDGAAGNVTVQDANVVLVEGIPHSAFQTGITADTRSSGNGGVLDLDTRQLVVTDGGQVSAIAFASGRAGTLTLNASGQVDITGTGSAISFDSRSATPEGGRAGDLAIVTPVLRLTAGGRISARTAGGGNAGILEISEADLVTIDGQDSGIFFDTLGSGDAEGITITTQNLLISNNGRITVEGQRSGSPGDIVITVDNIEMNNRATISATTRSETRGNIAPLRIGSRLFMTDGSEISASALAGGSGGNIRIIAPNASIISRSIFEDNDIIAIAAGTGTGGSATAEAALVEGFVETRDGDSPFSDFSASSALGTDGVTRIDADFEEFEELPLAFSEANIAQVCRLERRAEQSAFVVTGRGGVPATPGEVLNIGEPEVGLVTIEDEASPAGSVEDHGTVATAPSTPPSEIVEPQGWRYNEAGQLVLVAAVPQAAESTSPIALLDCRS